MNLKFPQFAKGSAQSRRPYRLGVALSGGGARGFAHLGALRALRDCGLVPDAVAGCSAGAVVAAFYGAGVSEQRVLSLFRSARFRDFAEMKMPRTGLFALDRFRTIIEREAGCSRIEQLSVPTIICATDLDLAERQAFTSGPLGLTVTASCSIPIIFEPVTIAGRRYVDGGVLHNLPAWALRQSCDRLIGINCSPLNASQLPQATGILEVARRSFMMMTKGNVAQDAALCDLAVDLADVAEHQVFDLKNLELLVEHGYLTTIRAIESSRFTL